MPLCFFTLLLDAPRSSLPGEMERSLSGEAQDAGPMCASACREAELPGLGGRCRVGQLSPPGATEGE